MNNFIVYDFDGTIYDGDSSLNFYLFCVRNNPGALLFLPKQLWSFLLYKSGKMDKTQFKSAFFSFLRVLPDVDESVEAFWRENDRRLKAWYVKLDHADDIVISASPEFLLAPVCQKIGVKRLIATKMDKKTGAISGKNCCGEEKVNRLRLLFPEAAVKRAYSDSLSDMPLFAVAEQAYLVKKDRLYTVKGASN